MSENSFSLFFVLNKKRTSGQQKQFFSECRTLLLALIWIRTKQDIRIHRLHHIIVNLCKESI